METGLEKLMVRAEALLDRIEAWLPSPSPKMDWDAAVAWRWRRQGNKGWLQPVVHPHAIRLDDLCDIDDQKRRVTENTRQFVAGKPANNVLLTGARGTGKSSLIKAMLTEFSGQGLRVIEIEKDHLVDLPEVMECIAQRPERFILFCDDLSFETGEAHYKALKTVLDGSLAAPSEHVLVYATSNRRHLMPEFFSENQETRHRDGEIHPGETVEEKISLSDRFGLWVSFYPFDQEAYLEIAKHWVGVLGGQLADPERFRLEALQWALLRGSRSGRSAWHFARDWVGRQGMPRLP
ncbi:MAG: ATP-binding protein [Betaproteobacteria bacterium]|nr:ATP-binding protein [Betaproteobacteria bacterium]